MPRVIHNRGNPHSQIWIVVERPFEKDSEKGFLFSSGLGYVFIKMLEDAKITDYYIISRFQDLENKFSATIIENELNHFKPPIIIAIGASAKFFCSQLKDDTSLEKYVGSLLSSPLIKHDHYVIPCYSPERVMAEWQIRDLVVSLDLGKARSELDYYKSRGVLQSLPQRELKNELSFNETIAYLRYFRQFNKLSVDIESVYTTKKSRFYPHPGYPITIGIANSPKLGISFNLFWDSPAQNLMLWKELDETLGAADHIGQNYFNFDAPRLSALGFEVNLDRVSDTLIRHQILWPGLQHKLQFQTRQYTRQPYYKDEGKGWSIKDMAGLRRYNALDACVTYEVYQEQEREFNDRPHLR